MTQDHPQGLSTDQVAERVRQGKVNRTARSDWREYRDILTRNFFTLFNALVVPAAALLFYYGDYRGAFAVSGMAGANLVLGLWQEIRAKWHLDELAVLSETKVQAVRDGKVIEIPSSEVVQDDTLLLKAGEPIVADGVVLSAQYLEVDEALMTGESDPIPKVPSDNVLSGSYCVAGEGSYRAEKVGLESFAQHTTAEARSYSFNASPVQKSINILIRILTATAVTLCLIYVGLSFIRDDITNKELVQMIAATITSMVPQGLVLMATLAFILGAVRMSRKGAVVRHVAAVESMAAVDVLCMDKTGTLTTNRLQLDQVHELSEDLSEEDAKHRLRVFANVSMDHENKSIQALLQALGPIEAERLDQIPFKSQNRYSAVRAKVGKDEHTLVLGACETVGEMLAEGDDSWRDIWKELTETGLRLLMLAESDEHKAFKGSLDGFPLKPVALIALSDELRPEAGDVLVSLAEQGIAFKIISGDNPSTVRATVGHLDLPLASEEVVTGKELAESKEPGKLILGHSVFGRVAPHQKVEIVEALQGEGKDVAMIGDGVNDVLSIKKADLGIAMGAGSRACKTVAGLVLENNSFELLPETLEEGRTILRNLRRSAKLFLLKNVYTLILIVGAFIVFSREFPYLPQQVTLLNALTIGIPALLITLSKERSKGASDTPFLAEILGFAIRTGVIIGAAGLILFGWASRTWPGDESMQRTVLLSGLVLMGASALLRVLTDGDERTEGDRRFLWLAGAVLPVFALAMYVPWFADFLQLKRLGWIEWYVVLAVAVPAYGLCLLSDRYMPLWKLLASKLSPKR